jgi:GWxTD domain-containing protein
MEGIRKAGPEERFAAWKAFWLKRDPTPSTNANEEYGEFLRRLRHVLASFARHKPGWQTDMGKVYMRNGPPDKIESAGESATASSRPATYYTLWYYYSQGLVYVFEDVLGSGDPRLLMTRVM